MSDASSATIQHLIKLSKVDASLARNLSETKQVEEKLENSKKELAKLEAAFKLKDGKLDEERRAYQSEEKFLRDEQQKLIDRRKGLQTFTDYKLQQAAEKEIEQTSRQLGMREEKLLGNLEQIEAAEKEFEEKKSELESKREEAAKIEEDSKEEFQALGERKEELEKERQELASSVEQRMMNEYERIRHRFPVDPMVPIKKGTCDGCHMSLGPQIVVRVSRGEGLVSCPGCARILYLEEQLGEGASGEATQAAAE